MLNDFRSQQKLHEQIKGGSQEPFYHENMYENTCFCVHALKCVYQGFIKGFVVGLLVGPLWCFFGSPIITSTLRPKSVLPKEYHKKQ